ncbi:MAG: serine/threonine protein kinase [Proteobacteria bacterium]|nr:serine/threonine protein kinase [Pseudomonadota bacterium]
MTELPGYKIVEKITETTESIVYRSIRENEKKTFVIKMMKAKQLSSFERASLKQHFDLIKSADCPGVIKHIDILNTRDSYAWVLEDFNGVPLNRFLDGRPCKIKPFLEMAVQISEILGQLHQARIVHKDMKPPNILLNEGSGQIKISDFGISSIISNEAGASDDPGIITGTLFYMSPEQTGRMNRTVDYRTDLYSLGITFYEMLTGKVPFFSTDPMEIIHSHMARKPVPPSEKSSNRCPPVERELLAGSVHAFSFYLSGTF